MIRSDFAQRVQDGATFLDGNVPEWRSLIDVETLSQKSYNHCVVGQIAQHYGATYGLMVRQRWCMPLIMQQGFGFDLSATRGERTDTNWGILTELWRKEVHKK